MFFVIDPFHNLPIYCCKSLGTFKDNSVKGKKGQERVNSLLIKTAVHKTQDYRFGLVILLDYKMAAVLGRNSIWNSSAETIAGELYILLGENYNALIFAMALSILVISPIAVAANSSVIAAFIIDPLKILRSSPSSFMVFSLACLDCITALTAGTMTGVGALYYSKHQQPPFYMDAVLVYLAVLKITTILNLFALSVDRLIAVVTPLQHKHKITRRRTRIAMTAIWIYGILTGTVCTLLYQRRFLAVVIIIICHVAVEGLALKVSYFALMWAVHKQSTNMKKFIAQDGRENRNSTHRERKVTKAIRILLSIFHICYLPWILCLIILFACVGCSLSLFAFVLAFFIANTINFASSLIHPFLYAYGLPRFKKTLKYFLKKNS